MNARNPISPPVPDYASGLIGAAAALSGRDRHALDLSHVFRPSGEAMPDALVAEMRRHISGIMRTVEATLSMELSANGVLRDAISVLDAELCAAALTASPQLISASLFEHLRARAALALIARQDRRVVSVEGPDQGSDLGWLIDDPDARLADFAMGLMLAENRWSDLTGGGGQMPADLPADLHAELCWIVGAILCKALETAAAASSAMVQDAVVSAVQSMLTRHDEERGPVARAALLARVLLDRPDAGTSIRTALAHRRYLLVAAMAANRLAVPLERVLPVLAQGNLHRLLAVFRVVDANADAVAVALDALIIARGDIGAHGIAELLRDYQDIDSAQARSLLSELALPIEFSAKRALLANAFR